MTTDYMHGVSYSAVKNENEIKNEPKNDVKNGYHEQP